MSAGLPYWLDEPYEPRPALEGTVEVEACVIGAGVGGLSCAHRLAGHGVDTLVLERGTVASGASGRNGGFLLAGVAAFHNDARDLYGADKARRLYARTLDRPGGDLRAGRASSARATRCGGWARCAWR